jgi:chorismate synthase
VTVIISLAGLVAVPVLSAFGVAVYHKLDQVKEAANGNLARVMDMQQRTQAQLTQLALLLPAQQQASEATADAAAAAMKDEFGGNNATWTYTETSNTKPGSTS